MIHERFCSNCRSAATTSLRPAGSTSYSRCFRGKWERNSRQIEKNMPLSYGRIFLVTFSKPVQRKSAEDNSVLNPEREAV